LGNPQDEKLAVLVVRDRLLSPEQLAECRNVQRLLPTPRSLAQVIVARHYCTADQLRDLVAREVARRPNGGGAAPHQASDWDREDVLLGRELMARGTLDEGRVRECLALTRRAREQKPDVRLAQVILKKGYVSRDALRDALARATGGVAPSISSNDTGRAFARPGPVPAGAPPRMNPNVRSTGPRPVVDQGGWGGGAGWPSGGTPPTAQPRGVVRPQPGMPPPGWPQAQPPRDPDMSAQLPPLFGAPTGPQPLFGEASGVVRPMFGVGDASSATSGALPYRPASGRVPRGAPTTGQRPIAPFFDPPPQYESPLYDNGPPRPSPLGNFPPPRSDQRAGYQTVELDPDDPALPQAPQARSSRGRAEDERSESPTFRAPAREAPVDPFGRPPAAPLGGDPFGEGRVDTNGFNAFESQNLGHQGPSGSAPPGGFGGGFQQDPFGAPPPAAVYGEDSRYGAPGRSAPRGFAPAPGFGDDAVIPLDDPPGGAIPNEAFGSAMPRTRPPFHAPAFPAPAFPGPDDGGFEAPAPAPRFPQPPAHTDRDDANDPDDEDAEDDGAKRGGGAPSGGKGKVVLVVFALLLLLGGGGALGWKLFTDHQARVAAEKAFLEAVSAKPPARNPRDALKLGEALGDSSRAKPEIATAFTALKGEVKQLDDQAAAAKLVADLTDETTAAARLEAAEKAIALDPRCAPARLERGRARLALARQKGSRELGQARLSVEVEDFKAATEIDPKLVEAAWEQACLEELTPAGRDRMRGTLSRILEQDREGYIGALAAGKLRALEGGPRAGAEALEHFGRAVDRKTDSPLPYLVRARFRLETSDHPSALADAKHAVEYGKRSADALVVRAWARKLNSKSGTREARSDLDAAIALDESWAPAYGLRALVKYEDGDASGAEVDAARAIGLDETEPFALLAQAELVCQPKPKGPIVGGSLAAARPKLRAAIDRDDRLVPALVLRARLAREEPDLAAAIKDLNRVLEIDPQHAEALALRGNIYFQQKNFSEAKRDLDRAIEVDPSMKTALFDRAKLFCDGDTKSWLAAIQDLTKVLAEYNGDFPEASFYLGLAIYNAPTKQSNLNEAIEQLTRALEKPDPAWAHRAYSTRGMCYFYQKSWARSVPDLEESKKRAPPGYRYANVVEKQLRDAKEKLDAEEKAKRDKEAKEKEAKEKPAEAEKPAEPPKAADAPKAPDDAPKPGSDPPKAEEPKKSP
jgi:tetratricopeptide (TPR) repeat protein